MERTSPPETTTITKDRLRELLEKEQAADAAFFAHRALKAGKARMWREDDPLAASNFSRGYVRAIKEYDEAVAGFVVANPRVVVAPATTADDLPF